MLAALVAAAAAGCGDREPVPVVVTLRDSLVGEGKVAVFSNQTPNRLTVTVALENAAKQDRRSGNLDLEPNGTAEIGWMEGWRFESGETAEVSHPSYRSHTYRVP
jgi:hypothetical protein